MDFIGITVKIEWDVWKWQMSPFFLSFECLGLIRIPFESDYPLVVFSSFGRTSECWLEFRRGNHLEIGNWTCGNFLWWWGGGDDFCSPKITILWGSGTGGWETCVRPHFRQGGKKTAVIVKSKVSTTELICPFNQGFKVFKIEQVFCFSKHDTTRILKDPYLTNLSGTTIICLRTFETFFHDWNVQNVDPKLRAAGSREVGRTSGTSAHSERIAVRAHMGCCDGPKPSAGISTNRNTLGRLQPTTAKLNA